MHTSLIILILLILFICLFVLYFVLEYNRFGYILIQTTPTNYDIQHKPKSTDPKVTLINFGNLNTIHQDNQRVANSEYRRRGIVFDEIINYNETMLPDEYFEQLDPTVKASYKGFHYWSWKPWIILQTMKAAPEGSIVIYLDSGAFFKMYPSRLIRKTIKHGRVLFKNRHINRHFTKPEFPEASDEYLDDKQLVGGYIFVVNNPVNREFIHTWFKLCCQSQYVADSPDTKCTHRHDQCVLTLISYQNKTQSDGQDNNQNHMTPLILDYSDLFRYSVLHRRRKRWQPIFA